MQKPKIALMSYPMDNRVAKGTALYTRKLIEEFVKDTRFEWYLVHFEKTDDPLYKKAREIVMPEVLHLPFGTRFIRTMLFFWKYRNDRFDIIHWFQPRLYPFFWFAPARILAATLHGAGDVTAPAPFVFSRSVFNFVLKHFNHHLRAIIAVSGFAREEIREAYGASLEKIYAIYNGGGEDYKSLPKEEARRTIVKYGIQPPFILDVSRLIPHKNVERLVRAYTLAREKAGFPHKLIIVGFKGNASRAVLAAREESTYRDDIHIVNYVEPDDLNALYSAADVFVFPSLNEGFGLPVIEAFASSVPVITSNVTALPEVAGDAALLVDPCDTDAIADAICEVIGSAELRTKMITRGLLRAREFTWKKAAQQTLALYERLMAQSSV